MYGLRSTAFLAVVLLCTGCDSVATTAPATSADPSTDAPSQAPTRSEAPNPHKSDDSAAVGSEPGTVSVTVGSHGAGFLGLICAETGNGQLSLSAGDPNDGEAFALVFRSDGTVSSLSGALRGVIWEVTQNPHGTLNADQTGSFSGSDAISGAGVSGSFACK
jgi:hypothetical protein